MYLIEGSSLSARGVSVRARDGDLSYRGRIKDVSRIERGASWNGFTTESPLPSDGSLAGKTLLLTLGDGRTEGYTVDRVETNDRESRIYVREEPGMELREDGALAKLVYFPWHGVPGQVDFLISGSVLRDAEGNVTSTAPLVEGSLASPSSSEGER
jgi:hypothetical protein